MTAPTGNALLTLTQLTNLTTTGAAIGSAMSEHKTSLEFALSAPQLPAQGAPLEVARCQAALDALNALMASPEVAAFNAAMAEIQDSVDVLNEAANQT